MHTVSSHAMHVLVSACGTAIFVAGLSGQALLGPKPSAVQHVTVSATTVPDRPSAGKAAGARLALQLDVVPKARIHVYASGSKEFTGVSLVLSPRAGISAGKPVYPAADPAAAGEDDAPVYRKPFRITQPIVVQQPLKEDVVLSGVLSYQACDDRMCYPVATLPVNWTIHAQ
jgi:hypothetical protein